jgi:hypothetical protein
MPVGSFLIPPGETRHFDEADVPHHLRPSVEVVEAPAPVDPLAEILLGNVASVVSALDGMLIADIEKLGELERAGQGRKGVLGPIANYLLNYAQNAEMREKVAALSDVEIAGALEAAATGGDIDPAYLAALEAAKRNPGAAA